MSPLQPNELLRVEGNVAVVRLHGACVGCNAAAQTLKDGIEVAVRARGKPGKPATGRR